MPTFERIEPLQALLESLSTQQLSAGRFELVVSDDGSGPGVEQAVRGVAGRFARTVFTTDANRGPGVARNRGVASSSGGVVAFVDSDCWVEPGWLEALVPAAEAGALAHGPIRSSVPPMEPWVHSFQIGNDLVVGTNFAIARERFLALRGFDPRVSRIAEDREFFDRVKRSQQEVRFVPRAVFWHPPRLKEVVAPWARWEEQTAAAASLRAFYALSPARRRGYAAGNRRLAARAVVKGLILLLPAVVSSSASWPGGLLLLLGFPFFKWGWVNRRLRAAGTGLRVPTAQAFRFSLLFPIVEIAQLISRARLGLLFLR